MTEPICLLRANAVDIFIAEYLDDEVLDLWHNPGKKTQPTCKSAFLQPPMKHFYC